MQWVPHQLLAIGWNERVLTDDDFDLLSDRLGLEVIELPFKRPAPCDGFYTVRRGRDVIVVDLRLRGLRRRYTVWHELSHALLHSHQSVHCGDAMLRKLNAEAHALALCALVPEPLLRRLLAGDAPEDDTLSHELIKARLEILERYNV